MLLVLTYHRIVERADAIGDFFDVTIGELERHIRLARELWGCAISLNDVHAHPGRPNRAREGFLVTFDDGTVDHHAIAAPVLERHNLRGVFFVNTQLVGNADRMTVEQCLDLQSRGHFIESHSHDHAALTVLSDRDLHWQLSESRRRLRDVGLGQHDVIATPGGFFDARVRRAATACGYRLLRTLEWGYNRSLDPLRLESITMNRQTTGRCSAALISPRGEAAKKGLYRAKELAKRTGPSLYLSLRDSHSSH